MENKKDKNNYPLYLVFASMLVIGGTVFLHNYLISSRIADPNSLKALLTDHSLQEQAKKKVNSPVINVDFLKDNKKFNDLEEIKIEIKNIEDLNIGKDDPFRPNIIQRKEVVGATSSTKNLN